MDFEEKGRSRKGSSIGSIIGVIVVVIIGRWVYENWIVDNSKAWWSGTESLRVCGVHRNSDDGCRQLSVVSEDGRVTWLYLEDGEKVVISTNDCDMSDIDGGMAGKGNRYCVIGEIGGGREWQVNQR